MTKREQLLSRLIVLSNGVSVANFSSPHTFEFEDGNVLPAVPNEEAQRLKVTILRHVMKRRNGDQITNDVRMTFTLSDEVLIEMGEWIRAVHHLPNVVIIVPLMHLQAMGDMRYVSKYPFDLVGHISRIFRSIVRTDRVKPEISISEFCVL